MANRFRTIIAVTIALTLAGGGMGLSPLGVRAQEDSTSEFPGRLDGGGTHAQDDSPREFPGRRVGGGTRGGCWGGPRPLLALHPANNLGVTAAAKPTLYFVLPSLRQAQEVEFLLVDDQQKTIYEHLEWVEPDQAILAVQIPDQYLALGQPHQWYFAVICDRDNPAQDLVVDGWLQRVATASPVSPSPEQLPADLERLKGYQAQGLWTDAIALITALRQAHPENPAVQAQWQALITTLGFGIFDAVLP
ncbi:MAG: DUF928 domain-containing protein [Spirulina sp. DLM2.Bin59]|nr:MAG: DUF928 domain-containing protein [Spirulina sp. DLM2.Bin59]